MCLYYGHFFFLSSSFPVLSFYVLRFHSSTGIGKLQSVVQICLTTCFGIIAHELFYLFKFQKKKKIKEYFMTLKWSELSILVSKFYWNTATFICLHIRATFPTQWQSQVIVTEIAKPKIFITWPEKISWLLFLFIFLFVLIAKILGIIWLLFLLVSTGISYSCITINIIDKNFFRCVHSVITSPNDCVFFHLKFYLSKNRQTSLVV